MLDVYGLCPCGSGEKLKFCCYKSYKKGDFGQILKSSFKLPIYECIFKVGCEIMGLTSVNVVRVLSHNRYVLVSFLIDTWCLGVKSLFVKMDISKKLLEEIYAIQGEEGVMEFLSYEDARSLILGAVDYADSLGFAPCAEWNQVKAFVEDDEPYKSQCVFGNNGAPFYIWHPGDKEKYDINKIISTVKEHGGDWVVPVSYMNEEFLVK